MFVFSSPTTTLLVSLERGGTSNLHRALRELGDVEKCTDIGEALERAKFLCLGREAFLPFLEAQDSDRLATVAGGERLLRVSCNLQSEARRNVPREVSIIVMVAKAIDRKLKDDLKLISAAGVYCVLVTSETIGSDAISELFNRRLIHSLLFSEDADVVSKIKDCVRRLRRDFETARRDGIARIVANGATAFVSDKSVIRFVEKQASVLAAAETLLCLDPAGFLIKGRKAVEFLMIVDQGSRQALKEIAKERQRGGWGPRGSMPGGPQDVGESATKWERVGRIERLDPKSKWYACRIAVSGPATNFLKSFQ